MANIVKNWTEWLVKSRFEYMSEEQKTQTLNWLFSVRDKVLDRANLKKDDVLIDIGTGTGLLTFGAYEKVKKVIASDKFPDCLDECLKIAEQCEISANFEVMQSDAEKINLSDNSVDVVVMRSVLVHILDKQQCFNEFYRILKPKGRISLFEPILSSNTKYTELVYPDEITDFYKIKEVENKIMSDKNSPLMNFNDISLKENLETAGFLNIQVDKSTEQSTYMVLSSMIEPWFDAQPSPGSKSFREKFLDYLLENEVNLFIKELKNILNKKEITVKTCSVYISANK
ncbi:MAG: class I SAM-dependent methyltransferase [Candidatus Gastranaerophilales bacterium]|nr:class I SAM-dependent methyltransferase [Candidatus Gastranaerophilales bacterium]